MKRRIGLFLALILTFALAGDAFAEGDMPTFAVSEATAAPGETVEMTVSLANNPGIASAELIIQYDHTVLELTNIAENAAAYPGLWTKKAEEDSFTYWSEGGRNNAKNEVIVTLTFAVKNAAAAGDCKVTVTYDEDNVYDEDEVNVHFAVTPGKVTVTGDVPQGPAFMTQSLVLEGDIGVRFYVRLPEELRNGDTYVSFTVGGKDGDDRAATVPYSKALPTNDKGCVGFTFYVNAVRMADTVTATLHCGDGETVEKTYSIVDYFETFDAMLKEHSGAHDDRTVKIVRSTADLGHYMQAYIGSAENGDHAAMRKFYSTYTDADLAEATATAEEHALATTGNCPDIKGLSYKVDFGSKTSIRLIVQMQPGFSGTLTAAADGAPCAATRQSDAKYLIEIANVQAHQLSHRFEIAITTENGTLTLTGSGLSYAQMALAGANGNPVTQNAMTAFCRYSQAADAVKRK